MKEYKFLILLISLLLGQKKIRKLQQKMTNEIKFANDIFITMEEKASYELVK